MKRIALLTLAIPFVVTTLLFAMTGREIIDKSEKLAKPKSAKTKVTMNIYKGSSVNEKEFILMQKTTKSGDRVLITFTKPTQIKVLTHTKKDGEDDQWLRLSSGKVKRIVGGDKSENFVQSHMTYEDLESRDVENYTYKTLADAKINGDDCYTVEAIKKSGNKTYNKYTLYVRKSDFFVVKIDFYQKDKLFKSLENQNIKNTNGILTPMKIVVTMADGSGRTELVVQKVLYNIDIEDSTFSKDALR
ncbi:MAG TPA: outer membrane lipoprotein-sorting protein [Spirochaetota bacterium]|nr:outer membrane lipoprotein-sorting protein [Spirochaetota bacterium]